MEFASCSSSSSSSSFLKSEPHFIYDVFINFGGKDIGRKLVSHLHSVLLQAQVKTLVNEENVQEGMKLEERMGAIAVSKIAIIVFSKTYTESTCCLLELEKIIECLETFGQVVLPVFYEIEPLDVRDQKDDFGKALEETAKKSYLGEQVEHALSRWRRALTTAASMNSWDVRDFRDDAELVEVIVRRVQALLDYKDLFVTQFPVGLELHVEKVIECIQNHNTKVCIIGIWGMVGTGKTTIAKAIYKRIYRLFIGKSFVENIREFWSRLFRTYVDLQEHLLDDVLKNKFEVGSDEMGRNLIETKLSRKKLLIVLDDVTEFGQLENLCGNCEWFGRGTVIIITTRDFKMLNRLKVNYVYKMDAMNKNDSLELFSWYAFREAKPRKELNEISRNIVANCGGLPLALKVLGGWTMQIPYAQVQEWKCVSLRLPNAFAQVREKLKISFDGLGDMEKDIFLDVCCFFIGKERGYVTEILNACGLEADIGITVLIERDFIKVERNNKLGMHPLLRDMGREITRRDWPQEPGKRSRLWFHEDVKDILKTKSGTKATQGLSLKLHSTSSDCFKAQAFKNMKSLRLLQLDHVQLTGDYGSF